MSTISKTPFTSPFKLPSMGEGVSDHDWFVANRLDLLGGPVVAQELHAHPFTGDAKKDLPRIAQDGQYGTAPNGNPVFRVSEYVFVDPTANEYWAIDLGAEGNYALGPLPLGPSDRFTGGPFNAEQVRSLHGAVGMSVNPFPDGPVPDESQMTVNPFEE
jgi:hypothetical protein